MGNEVRLIDANALYDKLEGRYKFSIGKAHEAYGLAIDDIVAAPTIDPESLRPKGRWTAINAECRGYANAFECSNCETISHTHTYMKECDFDFCPVCGAKMEG